MPRRLPARKPGGAIGSNRKSSVKFVSPNGRTTQNCGSPSSWGYVKTKTPPMSYVRKHRNGKHGEPEDRRPKRSGFESGQSLLSEDRIQQRSRDRLLRSNLAVSIAAPRKACHYPETLSGRSAGIFLL